MPPSPPAPLPLRLAAAVYDLFPLIALWMLTAGLFLLAAHGDVDAAHPPFAYRFALRAALLVVSAGYFAISWSRGGQTIGMRAWRIRVVTDDGGPLPWPRALLRFAVALLSLSAAGLGFLWCLIDRDRRGWHDLVARSAVVRLPK
jgi:uncharacterized RDD family membrane protein YckC